MTTFWFKFIQSLPTLPKIDVSESIETKINPQVNNFTEKGETMLTQNIPTISNSPTPVMAQVGAFPFFGGVIGLVVFLLLFAIWAYSRVYVITPNNEAFVKTGGFTAKGKTVILNGGCIVIPGFNELTRVPLREISIDVVRRGQTAVRTQDYLRANMQVTFYVCIKADKDAVLMAAQRLSKQGKISESDIKDALEKRADDAIRAAAKKKTIAEIDSDKLGFADEVLNLIQQDLTKVGLTLNNIAISEIEESDTYNENDYFDAQGVRLRTETIQKSIKQKLDVELQTQRETREIQLNTQIAIEQQELEAEKQSLTISKDTEEAKLTQMKDIEFLKAQREREIQESKDQEATKIERNKILQQKAVEEEQIKQKLSIKQREIEANIALEEQKKVLKIAQAMQQQEAEVAQINQKLAVQQSQIDANIAVEEQNKTLKVAQAMQQQESEVAEINRQEMVDASRLRAQISISEAEQESRIAQQEANIAIANKEKERFMAEAERAQAEEAVLTAKMVENAEREQKLQIIGAEREAQEKRIGDQNVIEIDVFRRRRQAEISRQAAELEAKSINILAEANRFKQLAEAEGKRALIESENALSDANRTAQIIRAIWPQLAPQLPEILKSLAPQAGVLGDARIYSFPGANGNGNNGNGASGGNDINKLLLSTSGLSLINTLMDEGKLGNLLGQIKNLLKSDSTDNQTNTHLDSSYTNKQENVPDYTVSENTEMTTSDDDNDNDDESNSNLTQLDDDINWKDLVNS